VSESLRRRRPRAEPPALLLTDEDLATFLVRWDALPRRQQEILLYRATGKTYDEIAATLYLEEQTAKNYGCSAYKMLGLSGQPIRAAFLMGAAGVVPVCVEEVAA
jgi:DNA-binding NarL/FixJ family response regulator